jgi:hypothetical protein
MGSAVGETVSAGAAVGVSAEMVEVGTAVEGIGVGGETSVDSRVGTGVAVQAVRRRKMLARNFFMILNHRLSQEAAVVE